MIFQCMTVLALIGVAHPQTNVGDSCVDQHTNVVGICTEAYDCVSAKNDYMQNGIYPTFCNYANNNYIVCCRDGTNILQTASSSGVKKPVKNENRRDRRRLSDRKCEEYSRAVTQTVDFIPLVPDPETFSISAANCDYTGVELVVGGENALQGEFPHMAALGWVDYDGGYAFNCGGSLVSSRFVLTAGHCTWDPRAREPAPSIVRLGDQNIDPSVDDGAHPIDVPIKTIHKHPEYKPPFKYHDIALLELNADVDFEATIRPACLWSQPGFGGHLKAIATGWGVNDTTKNTVVKELQKVSLSLLENEYCAPLLADSLNRHWHGFEDSQLCAGELRDKKDTCQGDSGSPLQVASKENQCIFYVMGVVSFGKRCATGRPAIYSRVATHLDWIEQVVWPGEQ